MMMPNENIKPHISLLLSSMDDYGEFSLPEYPKGLEYFTYNNVDIENWTEEKKKLEYNGLMKLLDEVLIYLVSNGFATNRHDIREFRSNGERRLFRQLTERGRRLKELGNYNDFVEEEKIKKRRDKRNEKLISIGYMIAVLVGVAAVVSMIHDIAEMTSQWPVASVVVFSYVVLLSICILGIAALRKLATK